MTKRVLLVALILFTILVGGGLLAYSLWPSNAKLLVGKWAVTKGDEELPVGATLEFSNDGKYTIVSKKKKPEEGSYKLSGDKIQIAFGEEKKDPLTIKKISDQELVLDAEGTVFEFKRMK